MSHVREKEKNTNHVDRFTDKIHIERARRNSVVEIHDMMNGIFI